MSFLYPSENFILFSRGLTIVFVRYADHVAPPRGGTAGARTQIVHRAFL